MEINYHIPSFTEHYSLNLLVFDYMQERPEYFRDGIKIASVFGCFGGSLWNVLIYLVDLKAGAVASFGLVLYLLVAAAGFVRKGLGF